MAVSSLDGGKIRQLLVNLLCSYFPHVLLLCFAGSGIHSWIAFHGSINSPRSPILLLILNLGLYKLLGMCELIFLHIFSLWIMWAVLKDVL